jgi:hypothetical protein
LRISISLGPHILMFKARVVEAHLDKGIDVIWLPGSPYVALPDSLGSATFPLLPTGTHRVLGADFHWVDGMPAARLFCTPDSLRTDRAFAPEVWEECGG